MLKFNPWTSKTIWGAVVVAGAYLTSHVDPTAVSPVLLAILQAVGAVLASVGVRDAIAKGPTP